MSLRPREAAAVLAGVFVASLAGGWVAARWASGGSSLSTDGLVDPMVVGFPAALGEAVARSEGRPLTAGELQQLADLVSQNQQNWWNDPVHKRELIERLALERWFSEEAVRRGLDRDPMVRARMAYAARSTLIEALMNDVRQGATPEAAARAYYESHKGEFGIPTVRLSVAAFPTEDAARAALAEVAAGRPFTAVVARSVDAETRARGGAIGPLRATELPQPWQPPARLLSVGQVSDPVPDGPRTWLVRLEERTGEPPFEEVAPAVRMRLQGEAQREFVQGSRERLDLVVDEDAFQRFVVR